LISIWGTAGNEYILLDSCMAFQVGILAQVSDSWTVTL
jgi:hypothetical protein